MEYVYAAMLLHKAGKQVDESNVTKVLQAVGVEANPSRVKALVAALSEINIDEAIKSASTLMPAASTAPTESTAPVAEEKQKEEEEKGKKEEEALEGLGALFG